MNIDELKSHALAARRDIVTMIYESGIGHLAVHCPSSTF